MDMSKKHLTWAGAGLLLALTAGSPAVADDVELLLSTPATSNAAKPNVLFILDSSYSMTEIETSQEPYNASTDYSSRGSCDYTMYYWTTSSGIPKCGDQYKFKKTSFHCDQGRTQIAGAGSYTDTMAMYRKRKGKWSWQQLNRKSTGFGVECKEDSGEHGENSQPNPKNYARSGTNQDAYTNDPNLEVDWGTKPTQQIVTVYDPNYLNWYHNPPTTSAARTDIMKTVTKNVLGSINNVNVGIMHFNWDQGGRVVFGVKDLDSNRAAVDTVITNIPADGWTPLSETMYEAALYYQGLKPKYGTVATTDATALLTTDPMAYKQPTEYACSKNFIVLLSDGEPKQDVDVYTDVPKLPKFAEATGRTSCSGESTTNGACLDDIAEYLSKVDVNTTVPGPQHVTTYTIGFTQDLPILKKTAQDSGGEYYQASDVKTLTAALTDIVTNIFDRDISFTAPAIAVNAYNRTQHLNDLYVSVFRAADQVHWPGNMKKFTIKNGAIKDKNNNDAVNPDTGYFKKTAKNFWNLTADNDGADVTLGGAANVLPIPSLRKLYTNNALGDLTLPTNALAADNIASFTLDDFGLTGKEGEPTLANMIEWMRGVDVKDDNPDSGFRFSMGDTLHSQPAAVVYGNALGTYEIVVYNATNDGYLHAIDGKTGAELWSFVPKELLDSMGDLFANENVDYKNYGLDGDVVPIVKDKDGDGIIEAGEDFVYLVFGMRRGGDNYYMVEVTDRNKPKLRWIKTFDEMGQSWSAPVVAKVDVDSIAATGTDDAVLILGAGYDTAHDTAAHPTGTDVGAGVFMLDLETGAKIWRAGLDVGADLTVAKMKRSFPGRISVIDLNGDQYADRMYGMDIGGQLWRFDITQGKKPNELVAGGVIARFGAEGLASPTAAQTRRFYSEPDVSMFNDPRHERRYLSINIGSGYRAHPLDNSAADRFYSLRDANIFNALTQTEYDNYDIVKDSDLVDVAGKLNTVLAKGSDGWKFTLPPTEKVLSTARVFDNEVYFVSFEPTTDSDDPCKAGLSQNRLYRVSVLNGDPIVPLDENVTLDAEDIDAARVTKLEQGGIAPQPVFLFPGAPESCTGDECAPPPLACVGVECFDPEFPNHPVRTLWTQDGIE